MIKVCNKINLDERDSNCVVSSYKGMQNAAIKRVNITSNMIRDPQTAVWENRNVTVLRFLNPKNAFKNFPATEVMGRVIMGNAVLVTSANITAEEIQTVMDKKNFKPISWASLASRLPKEVPLDDAARERRAAEHAEREAVWSEYRERRKPRPADFEEEEELMVDDWCMDESFPSEPEP